MKAEDELFGNLFAGVDEGGDETMKVSRVIDISKYPGDGDITKINDVSIYQFCKTLGDVGFCGNLFQGWEWEEKTITYKSDPGEIEKLYTVGLIPGVLDSDRKRIPFSELSEEDRGKLSHTFSTGKKVKVDHPTVGSIDERVLQKIGNAGIMANGKICTMDCHEWTSGIQLSPEEYKEFLKSGALDSGYNPAYDGTVCGLSDVLEEDVDEKYNLSWRACYGILKRAKLRGKELPEVLEIALVSTIIENAGIVKWFVLNGKAEKKKPTDMSVREIAKDCYEKYIEAEIPIDTVEAVEPKRELESDDDDEADDNADCESTQELEDDGFGILRNVEGEDVSDDISGESDEDIDDLNVVSRKPVRSIDTKLDSSRVEEEVSPTLLATSFKEPPAVIK